MINAKKNMEDLLLWIEIEIKKLQDLCDEDEHIIIESNSLETTIEAKLSWSYRTGMLDNLQNIRVKLLNRGDEE